MAEKKLERCVQLGRGGNLSEFLEKNRPSKILSPNTFWVMVVNPSHSQSFKENPDQVTVNEVFFGERWQHIKATREKITADDIKYLAAMTGFVSGKWIINLSKGSAVDDIWNRVATATVKGQLGIAAKVSSREASGERAGQRYLVIVWTADYTDERDLRGVEARLRHAGVTGPMSYKPDIYKRLGIRFRNEWNVSPVYLFSGCSRDTKATGFNKSTDCSSATMSTMTSYFTDATNSSKATNLTETTNLTDVIYSTKVTNYTAATNFIDAANITDPTEENNTTRSYTVRRLGHGSARRQRQF